MTTTEEEIDLTDITRNCRRKTRVTMVVHQISLVLLKQGEKSADNCNLGYVQIPTPMTMDTHI
jgi:hypothetical protein